MGFILRFLFSKYGCKFGNLDFYKNFVGFDLDGLKFYFEKYFIRGVVFKIEYVYFFIGGNFLWCRNKNF